MILEADFDSRRQWICMSSSMSEDKSKSGSASQIMAPSGWRLSTCVWRKPSRTAHGKSCAVPRSPYCQHFSPQHHSRRRHERRRWRTAHIVMVLRQSSLRIHWFTNSRQDTERCMRGHRTRHHVGRTRPSSSATFQYSSSQSNFNSSRVGS